MTKPTFWQAIKKETGPILTLDVFIYQRPHMRDEGLEFELQIGRTILEDCFDNFRMRPDVESIFLSFPENLLNIVEQRVLYERLWYYCPNLKNLVIKTQSVYIIQMTPAEHCKIIRPKQCVGNPLPSEDLSINSRLWEPMVGNVFDINKLNVV